MTGIHVKWDEATETWTHFDPDAIEIVDDEMWQNLQWYYAVFFPMLAMLAIYAAFCYRASILRHVKSWSTTLFKKVNRKFDYHFACELVYVVLIIIIMVPCAPPLWSYNLVRHCWNNYESFRGTCHGIKNMIQTLMREAQKTIAVDYANRTDLLLVPKESGSFMISKADVRRFNAEYDRMKRQLEQSDKTAQEILEKNQAEETQRKALDKGRVSVMEPSPELTAEFTKQKADLTQRNSRLEAKCKTLQEALNESKASAKEPSTEVTDDIIKQKVAPTQQNADMTQQNAALAQQNADFAQLNTNLTQQNAAFTQQNADMTQQNAALAQQNADFAQQNADLTQQNSTLQKTCTMLQEALNRSQKSAKEQETSKEIVARQNSDLQTSNQALAERNAHVERIGQELEGSYKALEDQKETVEQANKTLTDEKNNFLRYYQDLEAANQALLERSQAGERELKLLKEKFHDELQRAVQASSTVASSASEGPSQPAQPQKRKLGGISSQGQQPPSGLNFNFGDMGPNPKPVDLSRSIACATPFLFGVRPEEPATPKEGPSSSTNPPEASSKVPAAKFLRMNPIAITQNWSNRLQYAEDSEGGDQWVEAFMLRMALLGKALINIEEEPEAEGLAGFQKHIRESHWLLSKEQGTGLEKSGYENKRRILLLRDTMEALKYVVDHGFDDRGGCKQLLDMYVTLHFLWTCRGIEVPTWYLT